MTTIEFHSTSEWGVRLIDFCGVRGASIQEQVAELFANRLAKIYIARCYCFIFHWRGFDARPAQCIFLRYFRKRVRAFFFFFSPSPPTANIQNSAIGKIFIHESEITLQPRCFRFARSVENYRRDSAKVTYSAPSYFTIFFRPILFLFSLFPSFLLFLSTLRPPRCKY